MIFTFTKSKPHQFSLSEIILFFFVLLFIILGKIIWHGVLLSPDSLIYLDSALNVIRGNGCVHSFVLTSDILSWDGRKFVPVGYWSPGYIYFLASILMLFDVSDGVYIELAQGLLLCVTYLLIALLPFYEKKGSGICILTVSLLTFPITYTFSWLWSEGLSSIFLIASLFFCVIGIKRNKLLNWFVVGILAGICFLIRYVSICLVLFSILLLFSQYFLNLFRKSAISVLNSGKVLDKNEIKVLIYKILLLLLGWSILAGPLFLRNYFLTGSVLGYTRESSLRSFSENLKCAISTIFYNWFDPELIPLELQGSLILSLFMFLLLLVIWKRKYMDVLNWVLRPETLVLLFWTLFYIAFVVFYSSVYSIDVIGLRLLFPAFLSLIVLIGAFISNLINILNRFSSCVVCGVSLLVFSLSYPYSSDTSFTLRQLSSKERIKWVCENTTSEDLILGDSTFDLSIFCGVRRSICFIPGSKKDSPPEYELIKNLLHTKPPNAKFYVVLRKAIPLDTHFRSEWKEWFGETLANLFFNGSFNNLRVDKFEKGKDFLAVEVKVENYGVE